MINTRFADHHFTRLAAAFQWETSIPYSISLNGMSNSTSSKSLRYADPSKQPNNFITISLHRFSWVSLHIFCKQLLFLVASADFASDFVRAIRRNGINTMWLSKAKLHGYPFDCCTFLESWMLFSHQFEHVTKRTLVAPRWSTCHQHTTYNVMPQRRWIECYDIQEIFITSIKMTLIKR